MKLSSEQRKLRRAAIEAKRRKTNREMSAAKAAAGLTFLHGRVNEEVAAARLSEIPADTRTLTQRICGDPLPGRDALSRSRQSGVAG